MTNKPQAHNQFMTEFPAVAVAYEQLASAVHQAGPLDDKTRQLVKLALATPPLRHHLLLQLGHRQ